MQQISLVWILQKVLQIRHSLTPFSTSEREAVKTNARSYPVLVSSTTTTTSRLRYFISSEKATKISPPSSASDFTHSVFHGCKFWDWNTFLSSPVCEQSIGKLWTKSAKFSSFWSKGLRFSGKCSFFGQSLSRGHYQPTYQQARKGFIYFISLPLIFNSQNFNEPLVNMVKKPVVIWWRMRVIDVWE